MTVCNCRERAAQIADLSAAKLRAAERKFETAPDYTTDPKKHAGYISRAGDIARERIVVESIAAAIRADTTLCEAEAAEENLPCGHRARDCDDTYGGCSFCATITHLHASDDAMDALEDRAEAAERALARRTEALHQREHEALEACQELDEVSAKLRAAEAKIADFDER